MNKNPDGSLKADVPSAGQSVKAASFNHNKRHGVFVKVTLALLLLGLGAFFYWYFFLRLSEWTEDAYVGGNTVNLMASQEGIVTIIIPDDTNYVEQGQLLVQLDTTLFRLDFDQAKERLALAARQVRELHAGAQQKQANVTLRQAEVKRAREDYERRSSASVRAIGVEDLQHSKTALDVADAALNVSQHELTAALAALGTTRLEDHPTIQNAAFILRQAYVKLHRTALLAPVSGFIAQRHVQVGEWVASNRPLMSIVPLNQIWVDANFKETELTNICLGQPVKLTADLYGSHVVYHGKVDGIVAGTGGVFSLLPPQNATGNWIKIVQRVPVRIYLNPEEVRRHPLFLGLSMYTQVDTTNQDGVKLDFEVMAKPKFETDVYEVNMGLIDKMIEDIIASNLYFNAGLPS